MIKLKHLIFENVKFRDDGGVEISSPDLISDTQWAKVAKFIYQKGYNIFDADDAKNSVTKFLKAGNGVLMPDEDYISNWISAIKLAFGAAKRTTTARPDSKKIFSKAKRYFGVTPNLKLAGYILPDGSLLNLSSEGYDRDKDHREITHVFHTAGIEVPSEYGSGTPYMREFMEMGAVRINGEHGQVDIATPLTGYQERILGVLFAKNDGKIDLDVTDKDYGRDARQYAEGTLPERILKDIGVFYRTGSLPKRSEFREINYPMAKGEEMQSYQGEAGWKGKVVWMPPDKFLRLVYPLPKGEESDESSRNLEHRMKNGLPVDFLVLIVDMANRKITGHEGRHRATVAKKLGIEKVPVLLWTGSSFPRVPQWTPDIHAAIDAAEFEPEYSKR